MHRFLVAIACISVLVIAACSGGGGGGSTLAPEVSTHILSGTVDSQVTSQSGASSAPVAGAAVHVIDHFTGQEVSTVLLTNTAGRYSLPVAKNSTYAVKAEKNGAVMKSLVTVADADTTSNVNPGSSAAVLVFQKKFSVTIGEAGTAFKTALASIDIAGTAQKIYDAATFGALAATVKSVVAANANPFTDATAATQAQTVADAVTPVVSSPVTTTPAMISSSNAKVVAYFGMIGGNPSSWSSSFNLLQKSYFKPGSADAVYDGGFGKPVADAIAALGGPRGATSIAGSCGGTQTTTTTATSASIVEVKYCTTGNSSGAPTTIRDGTITATGTSASATITFDQTASMSPLPVAFSKATIAGTVIATKTATTETYTVNVAYTWVCGTDYWPTYSSKAGTTIYTKSEDYKIDITKSGNGFSTTMSGKFYYDTAGYVTVSTPTPLFSTYLGSSSYISGERRLTGGGSPATIVRTVYTNCVAGLAGSGGSCHNDTDSYSTDGGATWTVVNW